MKKLNAAALLPLAVLAWSGASQAATVVATHEVSAAVVDPAYYGGGGGHVLWFSGSFGSDFVFGATPGVFAQLDDGTAVLGGTVYRASDPTSGFTIAVTMSGLTSVAPPGSPKKELFDTAYAENGGPIDVASWLYYSSWTGTLSGVGSLSGVELSLSQRGPAFQIGAGANGKNIEYGGSGWFTATDANGATYNGDFNLNLRVVPVPAALPLLLSALAGFGVMSYRSREKL